MATELVANSPTPGTVVALTTLAAPMASTSSLSFSMGGAAPAALQGAGSQFRCVIGSEIIIFDANNVSTSTWTALQRGAEGSTAATHPVASAVLHYLTAGALQALISASGVGSAYSGATTDQVYYVSKTGSDSTGDGTLGKPLLTIGAAIAAANAQSNQTATIKVGAGAYAEELWITLAIDIVGEGGTPGFGFHKATTIVAPSVSQNCINIIGGNAAGTTIRDMGTQGSSAVGWAGVGIRGANASQVVIDNWKHSNSNRTPTATTGGTAIAISHGEGWKVNGYQIADASQAIILGTNGVSHTFRGGQLANCLQDTFAGWWEGFRVPLASGVTSGSTSFSINNSVGLFDASGGLAIVDSEGIWYSTMTAGAPGTLNSVQRAIVGYLTGAINNSQTTGISIAPLSQGNAQATDVWGNSYTQPNTTIPASGSLVLEPGTGSAETITYTGLTDNGNGTFTPTGVARSGSPFSHSSNSAIQDAALASAASHSAGVQVIQASIPSGLSGIYGGGSLFEKHKSTAGANAFATTGTYQEEWWGGGNVFIFRDVCESVNANAIRFHSTSGHNQHYGCNIAPETVQIDDGDATKYVNPQGGTLVLSALSYRCSVEGNLNDPSILATQVTNLGTSNELAHGRTGPSPSSKPASGESADILPVSQFNPLDLQVGRQKDVTFAPRGNSEEALWRDDFAVAYLASFAANNSYSRQNSALIVPGPLNGPIPAFQVTPTPGNASTGTNGGVEFWHDGSIPNDQFTMVGYCQTDPAQATDLFNAPSGSNAFYLASGSGTTEQFLQVGKNAATTFAARFTNNESTSGMGGTNKTLTASITLTAPVTGVTCTQATSGTHLTAITGTVSPTAGTQVVGRGIMPGTYVVTPGGSSGAWTAILSIAPTIALTGTTVNFGDCPLNVAQMATISASGTTTSASTSVAYTGTTPPVVGAAARGPGIAEGSVVNATPTGSSGAYTVTISVAAGTGFGTGTVTFIDSFYPPNPWLCWTLIWDQAAGNGHNAVLMFGDGRKVATADITTGTASGTVAGNGRSVTNWPNAITPVAGMTVTGGGALPGTRIIGSVTGSTANWNFTVNQAIPSTGAQSLTVFNDLIPRPWGSQIGQIAGTGLYVGASGITPKNGDDIMIATAPTVMRYARNYSSLPATLPGNSATFATPSTPLAANVSIDLATIGGAWNSKLGGVVGKLAGHNSAEASEALPLVRNAQIDTMVKLGLPYRREDNFEQRAIMSTNCWAGTVSGISANQFTLTATTTPGAGVTGVTYANPAIGDTVAFTPYAAFANPVTITNVTGTGPFTVTCSAAVPGGATNAGGGNVTLTSTADLDVKLDRWHTAYGGTPGAAAPALANGSPYQFSQTLGWCPAALRGGVAGTADNPPTVTGLAFEAATALSALYYSQVVTHIQARYPTHLYAISFWNEPENSSWSPATTTTQFAQWWSTVSGQIASDQGANGLRLDGVDGQWMFTTTGQAWQQAIITQAASDSRSLPRLRAHNYSGDVAALMEEPLALYNAASASGFYPKVAISEYDLILTKLNERVPLFWDTNVGTYGVLHAAWVHHALWNMSQAGVDFANFWKLTQAAYGISSPSYNGDQPYTGVLSANTIPRLLPPGVALSMFWRHGGNALANVTTNWPGLKAFGSSSGPLRTVTISHFRPTQRNKVQPIQLVWSNLPTQNAKATGTVSATTTVTGWAGSTPPQVGTPVSGGGLAAGATVQGPITGTYWNWNFTLSSAASNGAQSLTLAVPKPFTWDEMRYDLRDIGEPRLNKVREGNQGNLPDGTNLTGCGLSVFRIYT